MKIGTDTWAKILGWLQIIGGITGLGLIGYLLLRTDAITGPLLLIFFVGLALFVFSIYTGKTLVFNQNKKIGLILTIINQAFQLFQWSILGYGFSYSSGAEVLIGIKGLSLDLNFSIVKSTFSMSINSDNPFSFSINLIALFIIVFVVKAYNKLNRVALLTETVTIIEKADSGEIENID